ncbi:dihydropteroate synthase [Desulfotomaculum copahuensis]|uniref:Dihydropteroate synthase n=1 Tax=Desulfotomaculum copahuensis TaxID=1838280 RepID=A0A1B7LCQ2_9FIRM|nr:dihydropteroate synthase [Desulfotomaculum copahuensis]OAT80691.1 dihydropteroate synthase [Desulfotomaculum copahuensis]
MSIQVRNIEIKNREQALAEIAAIGADRTGCRLMAPKAVHRLLKLSGVNPKQANIIKQEMLGKGGEAAIARGAADGTVEETDVLLMGTLKQYEALMAKLRLQPFGLAALAGEIRQVLQNLEGRRPCRLDCRSRSLVLGERTLIMGILNVTPDSFSDGGRFNDPERALEHARQMVADGADIIDLGGESTRPGYEAIPEDEELRRVMPVLEKLPAEIDVPVSIDTTKAGVARRALEAGAHIINDQWALRADPDLAGVAAGYDAPMILMHNQQGTEYRDMMGDMIAFFRESMAIAERAGLCRDKIIIDPGIGFGKTLEQNLEVMRRLRELDCLGRPVLLGTSRKSLIAKTLHLPADQRVEGTAATVAIGIAAGVDIVRVHDVKEMARVARMTDAMVRRRDIPAG